MAAAQVVETSVIVSNSRIQDSTHLHDHMRPSYQLTLYLITYSRHILLLCALFHLLRCKFPLQFCHYREKSEKYIVKGLSLQSNNYGAKEADQTLKIFISSMAWPHKAT